MKTAISIPDPIFKAAEGLAQRLGISRSQLYTNALAEYTKLRNTENITDKLNNIYSEESSELDKELSSMQFQSLEKEQW
ncbi:MAG: hypothetical protein V3U71_11830 [Cocleimonas sp.]